MLLDTDTLWHLDSYMSRQAIHMADETESKMRKIRLIAVATVVGAAALIPSVASAGIIW